MRRGVQLLLATMIALWLPVTASAAQPADPRIDAAVAAWAHQPLFVDPDFASIVDDGPLLRVVGAAPVPVYVAVVPTGKWFPEKSDTALLAGRLAVHNGKPGVYVVMTGDTTYGVAHEVAARAAGDTWANPDQSMSGQLTDYLAELRVGDRYVREPARTEPLPPEPETTYPEDRFTVGKAIGNGVGGGALGLLGGALLAGLVLGVAAVVAGRRGGRS